MRKHPDAHLLQTSRWGELKRLYGWDSLHFLDGDSENSRCGAQVLFKRLPFGFGVAYLPKGPVGIPQSDLLDEIDRWCMANGAVFLKIEPYLWADQPEAKSFRLPDEFRKSKRTIQPQRTILVNLSRDEDEILKAMKQKTRYNIRLAFRKGVVVRESNDVEAFYELMRLTGERDTFGIHSQNYYQQAYDLFSSDGSCKLFLAEYENQPLAGLMAFARGNTAWYMYGASSNRKRNLMPTYALHWEVMRWAKQRGCLWYDLWGVPDEDENVLEKEFTRRRDGLWGVYRNKRGFGGHVTRAVGAWDRVYHPVLYQLYTWWTTRKQHG